MKKLILSILFFMSIFQCVFSDQINQSNTNLDSIEVESGQQGKDQMLFEKTESTILLTDKNVSELDKEKDVDLKVEKENVKEALENNDFPVFEKKQEDNSTNIKKESSQLTDKQKMKDKTSKNTSDLKPIQKPSEKYTESLVEKNKSFESINEEKTTTEDSSGIDQNVLLKNKESSQDSFEIEQPEISLMEKTKQNEKIQLTDSTLEEKNKNDQKIDQINTDTGSNVNLNQMKAENNDEKEKSNEALSKKEIVSKENLINQNEKLLQNNKILHDSNSMIQKAQPNINSNAEFDSMSQKGTNRHDEINENENNSDISLDILDQKDNQNTNSNDNLAPVIQNEENFSKDDVESQNTLDQNDHENTNSNDNLAPVIQNEENFSKDDVESQNTLDQNDHQNTNSNDNLAPVIQNEENFSKDDVESQNTLDQNDHQNTNSNDNLAPVIQNEENFSKDDVESQNTLDQNDQENFSAINEFKNSKQQETEEINEKKSDINLDIFKPNVETVKKNDEEKNSGFDKGSDIVSEFFIQNDQEMKKDKEKDTLMVNSDFLTEQNEEILISTEENQQNKEIVQNSFTIQNEKNSNEKSLNYEIKSSSLFKDSVPEIPFEFESQNSDFENKIEDSRPIIDSLSKKFSNKIKKLKKQGLNNGHEDELQIETSNSTNDRICANLHNFKQILSEHFEPLYLPIVSLLPEDIQLILLNESFAGIPNASIIFLVLNIFLVTIILFMTTKLIEGKKINLNASLNNQIISQTNRIRQLEFDLKTFSSLMEESEQKKSANDSLLSEKESKIKELGEKLSKSIKEQEFNEKELEKFKNNERKLLKETNQLKSELNSLNSVFTQQKGDFSEQIAEKDTKILEFTQLIESQKQKMACLEEQLGDFSSIKDHNLKLNNELNECLNTIELLKNSLSIKNSSKNSDIDDYVQVEKKEESNMESLMNLAQLQMDYKTLQSRYDDLIREKEANDAQMEHLKNEIENRQKESGEWESRLKKFEKQIKENEMQIRLLNELREKDTKQHVKALTELDLQLKKKTADADKVAHYMEQLRVKQERIQELETNLTRVEKQTNVERQTFEKQMHENWLNAKKLDKELRETKLELENLKDRMRELESGITQDNLAAEQPPRPPSTSSNSGAIMPPNGPGFIPFMHPAFRYPFPAINPAQAAAFMQHLEQQRLDSNSPNQETGRIPNTMPPPHILQRFLQGQQFMQHQMANSTNSSQQVSPSDLNNSNILASTALNDISMNNMDSTQNMINDFDFSSNSGYFNQNGTENCNGNHPEHCSNENVNSNFNV